MKNILRLITAVVFISISCLLSLQLLFSTAYVSTLYRIIPQLSDPYGWSLAQRETYAGETVRYLRRGNESAAFDALYSPEEKSHLGDVRRVYVYARTALLTLIPILMGILLLAIRSKRLHSLYRVAKVTHFIFFACYAISGVALLFIWPIFFTLFHELLFADGTWSFPSHSSLIRLFPELFWMASAFFLGILTYAGLRIITLLLFYTQRYKNT